MKEYNHFEIIQLARKMDEAKERVDSLHYSLRASNEEVYEVTKKRDELKEKMVKAKAELDDRTKAIAEYFTKGKRK